MSASSTDAPQLTHLRLPRDLHAQLCAMATKEGVSLNQLCLALLAGAVRWEPQEPAPG